ncbi:hypothetical protein [Candidatus Uabimicrobium amorphum]|uniref:Uncharacterized protein n=1 Tax=Uabimicrobium amorphum TaxID=2596890 RepID=A0A5S9ISM9_UABAM|nr:hypothetical protein [Candidatus Uabimicrobium amorphum]BBM85915.1 hypothetical protein UABAM_04297 [Candidatus Uabimicrobium amorphum]
MDYQKLFSPAQIWHRGNLIDLLQKTDNIFSRKRDGKQPLIILEEGITDDEEIRLAYIKDEIKQRTDYYNLMCLAKDVYHDMELEDFVIVVYHKDPISEEMAAIDHEIVDEDLTIEVVYEVLDEQKLLKLEEWEEWEKHKVRLDKMGDFCCSHPLFDKTVDGKQALIIVIDNGNTNNEQVRLVHLREKLEEENEYLSGGEFYGTCEDFVILVYHKVPITNEMAKINTIELQETAPGVLIPVFYKSLDDDQVAALETVPEVIISNTRPSPFDSFITTFICLLLLLMFWPVILVILAIIVIAFIISKCKKILTLTKSVIHPHK